MTLRLLIALLSFAGSLCTPLACAAPGGPVHSYQKVLFGVPVKVLYDPRHTTVVDRPFDDDSLVGSHLILRTKFLASDSTTYNVYFSEGASNDFGFYFNPIGAKDGWVDSNAISGPTLWGTELSIPGDGSVLVAGHVNSMFFLRRLFQFESGKLIETKQPYHFVGLTAPTLKPLVLYSDRSEKQVLLTVPANTVVTVLASDDDHYLVKTASGLVGWTTIAQLQQADTIKGLFFNGD